MDQRLFDFSKEHFSELFQAKEVFQGYLEEIRTRWRKSFEGLENVVIRDSRVEGIWGGEKYGWQCIPIRFVFQRPDLEIVLKVSTTGRYGLNLYPKASIGLEKEQLQARFPNAKAISNEKGYLACIVADNDDLAQEIAFAQAIEAVKLFQVST